MVPAAVLFLLMLLTNVTPGWAETDGLPFRFELNRGQADSSVKYIAHAAGFTAGLNEKAVTLNLRHPVHMRFIGANPDVIITPQAEMALVSHYYRGESSSWHTDIKNYERLLYRDVYPGIDAVFRGDGRILEFDFLVHPGSNPDSIALDFSGQQDVTLDEDGVLILKTQDGDVHLHAPRIHQENNQERRPVAGRFVKKGDRFGFQLADYDKSQMLVIDPALTFSTYDQLGGNETPTGITVDAVRNIYVSYYTFDAADENELQFFLHKIPHDGSQGYITNIWVFRTNTSANALTVDAAGNAYVAGMADNTPPGPPTVPTINAIQPNDAGGIDAFVVKLDPTGKILFSTYLGGSGDESASAIGLDGAGGFWVAGTTTSTDFPIRNAFQSTNAGGRDLFLTRFNTSGTEILYSTFFGGNADDTIKRLLIDAGGNVFLAGETVSSTFTGISESLQSSTPECTDTSNGGVARPCVRIFLSKLNPGGTAVLQSVALKLTGGDNILNGFARAPDGSLFIVRAANVGTASTTYFVEKFNTALGLIDSKQIFATVNDIAVDTSGSVYLTGSVVPSDVNGVQLAQFPIVNSFKPTTTDADLFVMKLPPNGGFPVYSTLLSATTTGASLEPNGSGEAGDVITTDAQNRAYVVGISTGFDFPTTDGSRGGVPNRVSDFDPVVFVLDTNVPHSTTLYTRLEEWNPFIAYTGTWFPNASPNSGHSGGAAKLALDAGSKFSVSFTGAGELKWFGCKDEWAGIARVFLDGTLRATVDTYSAPGSCRQLIFSLPGIGPGSHTFTVEVTGTRNPASHSNWIWIDTVEITSVGDITLGTTTTDTGAGGSSRTTRIEQSSSAIQYSGHWFQNASIVHSGGSAVLATEKGSKATLSFTGTGVQWIGFADQWAGIANVYVDGVLKTEVDTFASPARAKTVLYSTTGLTPGNHTITIEVTGRRGARSAQSWVWIDAFDVTGVGDGPTSGSTNGAFTRVEQDSGGVQRVGQWFTNVNGTHSGGTAILALDAGAQVRFTFTGTAVRWIGLKDNWAGIAKVFIDGVLLGEIDTYATTAQVKTVLFEIAGLTASSHTITVETTGRKNAAAKSAWVWVDAFEFR